MTRKYKRGYVEKGFNNGFVAVITRVTQTNDFGKWEDEDEDEINRFGDYTTEEEAIKVLKEYFKCKEIIKEL